jgi:hypothetical protein
MGFVQKLDYQKKNDSVAQDKELMRKSRKQTKVKTTPKKEDGFDFGVKVGDIFYNSWGYEQTNIDWYQVVAITPTGKSVKVKRINAKIKDSGNMSGSSMPVKNSWHDRDKKVYTKKMKRYGNEIYLKFDHGATAKWDGKPKSVSWYH